ncbi:neuroglian, partial [Ixodes scapularis]
LNPFPEESPRAVSVVEGDPLSLDCNAPIGYPRPNVNWLILSDNGALRALNSSRITSDPEGGLHFSRVEREDALQDAVYVCTATSVFLHQYKIGNKVRLRVERVPNASSTEHAPVKQYLSPENLVALEGQELKLYCIFGGSPQPVITWRKLDTNMGSSDFTTANYGRNFVTSFLELKDEGTYECKAHNGVGMVQSHAINVTVESAPYWLSSPENTNAAEDESVSFECTASGRPEPKLQWFINGVPLQNAEPNPRRKVEGSRMTIEGLTKQDTAVYQCNASNTHGYAFKNFYLNVLALAPSIVGAPQHTTHAAESSIVNLRCPVFGAPRPEVRWFREGQELTGGRYRVLDNGDLRLHDLRVSDQGSYTCHARNKFGEALITEVLQVTALAPSIVGAPQHTTHAAESSIVKLRCPVFGAPRPEVKWFKEGQELTGGRYRVLDNGDLQLHDLRVSDQGSYTCNARNKLGEASITQVLQVTAPVPTVQDPNTFLDTVLNEKLPLLIRDSPTLFPVVRIPDFNFVVAKNALTNHDLYANLTEGAIQGLDTAAKRMGDCLAPAGKDVVPTVSCTLDLDGINATFLAFTKGDNLWSSLKEIWVHVAVVDFVARFEATGFGEQETQLRSLEVLQIRFNTTYNKDLSLNTERQMQFKNHIEDKVKETLQEKLYGEYKSQLSRALSHSFS